MNLIQNRLLIPVMALTLLASCNLEYYDFDKLSTEIELEPEIVAPLVHGRVTMEDLVEMIDSMGYTSVDEDGLIYIIYQDTGFSVKADTMVDISIPFDSKYYLQPDIIGNPGWGINVGDTTFYEKVDSIGYTLNENHRLDSVHLKAGDLQIDVMSEFRHTGILTITSDYIVDPSGNTFETQFIISETSGNFTDQKFFDMSDHTIKTELSEDGDSTFIILNFELALIYSGNTVEPGEECRIDLYFMNSEFNRIFGFIDKEEVLNESGEVEIGFFENRPELASVNFADPRINIYIKNSFGAMVELEINNMTATSSIDGSTVDLVFNGINPFTIGAPDITMMGDTVETVININNTTSNIPDLLNSAPSKITYDLVGRTTYESLDDEHFFLEGSLFETELELMLPLDLKTTGFSLNDTMDFELFGEDGLDTALIRFLEIDLATDNGLPVEFSVQLYFADENYTVIDSLFDQNATILKAAPVDAGTGVITGSEKEETAAILDNRKISKLSDMKYAIFQATILTSGLGDEYVKIYTNYEGLTFEPAYALDFNLSVYGGFKLNELPSGNEK